MYHTEEIEHCEHMHVHPEMIKNVNSQIPDEEKLYELADFFKVFADSTRIRILYVLKCSEMCVCDIAQTLDMTQSALSHQLRILKDAKLVKFRREGKIVFYSLDDEHVRNMLSMGMEHVKEK